MRTLMLIQWDELGSDRPSDVAPIMAAGLDLISQSVRAGEGEGRVAHAYWTIHDNVTFDEIEQALDTVRAIRASSH